MERPSWAPVVKLAELRAWLQREHCRFLRGGAVDDVDLLGDVADAFKHVRLDHAPRGRQRLVTESGAVVRLATGWSQLRYGEGKFGGTEQVVIQRVDGSWRALSSVLQNVRDAWTLAMGGDLGEIG